MIGAIFRLILRIAMVVFLLRGVYVETGMYTVTVFSAIYIFLEIQSMTNGALIHGTKISQIAIEKILEKIDYKPTDINSDEDE